MTTATLTSEMAGVEEADPGGELGGDVDDLLAVLEQSLRQRASGPVAALDRLAPIRPGLDVLADRK